MKKVKSWMKEYHPAVERFYSQFGWKYCPIKRYAVARWINATRDGGIQDQWVTFVRFYILTWTWITLVMIFFIFSGRQRRPWYDKVDRPRNQTVDKWIEDRIRFQIKVIQHLARNDGVINPHQLVRETGFTIGWVKRRLKQCDYRYYLHKKRSISKKI